VEDALRVEADVHGPGLRPRELYRRARRRRKSLPDPDENELVRYSGWNPVKLAASLSDAGAPSTSDSVENTFTV